MITAVVTTVLCAVSMLAFGAFIGLIAHGMTHRMR